MSVRVNDRCEMYLDESDVVFAPFGMTDRRVLRLQVLEAGNVWVLAAQAEPTHWHAAAELARKRLNRCTPGSDRWWAYKAIIAKAEHLRPSLSVVRGGAA